MITNLVVLSLSLLTNSQQAIVGESNGKALVASQETVVQRRILLEDVMLSNTVTTNAVGFAIRAPTNSTVPVQPAPVSPLAPTNLPSEHLRTNAIHVLNTNSPAYKRRLEREQRMRPSTNMPAIK